MKGLTAMRNVVVAGLFGLSMAFAVQAQQAPSAAPASMPGIQSQNVLDLPKAAQEQIARDQTQPQNNAPVWREVNSTVEHYSAIKTPEAGVLIQQGGHQWQLFRNGVVTVFGGWLLAIAICAVGVVYLIKGSIKLHEGASGKMMLRFTRLERWSHWSMAYSFVILAVSGIIIMWGRYFLLPIIGGSAYGPLTLMLKNIHNIVGPFFTISVVVFFVLYVRDNIPNARDLQWFLAGGKGSSHRFNGGEKLWFWFGVTVLGVVVSASGWVLNSIVPGFDYFTREQMQLANVVHGIGSTLFMAMAVGHIYIGTIGMQGAYQGMSTGYVDENWGKEHHDLWYNDVKSGGDHRGQRA
jgi:formate dehydrogenase subunit gamma